MHNVKHLGTKTPIALDMPRMKHVKRKTGYSIVSFIVGKTVRTQIGNQKTPFSNAIISRTLSRVTPGDQPAQKPQA